MVLNNKEKMLSKVKEYSPVKKIDYVLVSIDLDVYINSVIKKSDLCTIKIIKMQKKEL